MGKVGGILTALVLVNEQQAEEEHVLFMVVCVVKFKLNEEKVK